MSAPHVDPFAGIADDLELVAELSPADQVPVFSRIHAALTSALTTTAVAGDESAQSPLGER